MDLKKAQRLLTKIEAFLDNGNAQDLSRLEKDLIKSYIVQLYDAVTDAGEVINEEEKPVEFVAHIMTKREASPKSEIPQANESRMPKTETLNPFPVDHEVMVPKEKPIEIEVPGKEAHWIVPPVEAKAYQHHTPESPKETIQTPRQNQSPWERNEALVKLFDLPKTDEIAGRLNHVPIASIESAMGLNDRIFILKELFGGDKALFDVTCSKLNHLNTFDEARSLLIAGPARDFSWGETQRIKMAEQFIRMVSRRYPKSIS